MGLLGAILGLPLAPVRGVISLGRVIQQRVELEMRDPAAVRADLEAIEEDRAAGRISREDVERQEQEVVNRMTHGAARRRTSRRRHQTS